MERGIERTLLELEDSFGTILDALGDAVAVTGRFVLQYFEDQCR
jgi:hypothetical protein